MKRVEEFLDEERKQPGQGLNRFKEDFARVDDGVAWKNILIIADPAERQTILKEAYYDEA